MLTIPDFYSLPLFHPGAPGEANWASKVRPDQVDSTAPIRNPEKAEMVTQDAALFPAQDCILSSAVM